MRPAGLILLGILAATAFLLVLGASRLQGRPEGFTVVLAGAAVQVPAGWEHVADAPEPRLFRHISMFGNEPPKRVQGLRPRRRITEQGVLVCGLQASREQEVEDYAGALYELIRVLRGGGLATGLDRSLAGTGEAFYEQMGNRARHVDPFPEILPLEEGELGGRPGLRFTLHYLLPGSEGREPQADTFVVRFEEGRARFLHLSGHRLDHDEHLGAFLEMARTAEVE